MATREELIARIERLKTTRDDLENLYEKMALTGMVQEYKMNDGQTITQMIYKTPTELESAINGIQKLINKKYHYLNGREVILRDKDSFYYNKGR